MTDFVILSCPDCDSRLEVPHDIDQFACAECGANLMVRRRGGIMALELVKESSPATRVTTDDEHAPVSGTPRTKKRSCCAFIALLVVVGVGYEFFVATFEGDGDEDRSVITRFDSTNTDVIVSAATSELLSTTAPPTDTPTPIPTSTATPTATEAPSQNTPVPTVKPEVGIVPGIQAADITVNLEQQQFDCTNVQGSSGYYSWTCTKEELSYELGAEVDATTLLTVDCIEAWVVVSFGEPDDALSVDYLGFIATVPYDGARPSQARQWVEQTLPTITQSGDIRETTIAGVKYTLFGPPTFRNLQIGCSSTVPVSTNAPTPTLAASPIPTEAAPPTQTSVPTETSLPTQTPEISLTQTAQAFGPLITPKGNGTFTVGVTIAPGRWESQGTFSSCYWERLGAAQNILDNHFGFAGGTVTIQPSDHQVVFNSCGTWEYVEGRPIVLEADAISPKSDGFYTVGIEIATGRWESTGAGGSCYWERRDSFQGVIDNHFGSAGGTVTVQASDYEVNFNGCGTWVYLEGQSGAPQADPTAPRGDGFYTVGAEIATGQWHSTGAGGSCYWERRDVNQNIIDNYFGAAGVTVVVSGSDYEINFNGCGTWEYLGP